MIRAIEWCADNRIALINLSLGTINFRDFEDIEKAVRYAVQNGVVIVAACNNRNIFTCPASLTNVIGVKCDTLEVLQERSIIYNLPAFDRIDITACGSHELSNYNGKSTITPACNSFAAPIVTSIVYDIMRNNPGIGVYEIKEQLKEKYRNVSQVGIDGPDINNNQYNNINKSIDIPILALHNYENYNYAELTKQFTQKFRADGYNAILIEEKALEDVCAGRLSVENYAYNGEYNLSESIYKIFNIYDPDILIVSIDMKRYGEISYFKDIESFVEIDIKINFLSNSDLEVICLDETRGNNSYIFNDTSIDDLYDYIINLYS